MDKIKILFVCLGNICRSPAAEGIMKRKIEEAGLQDQFLIDSAGILNYHEGELPDSRMRMHAKQRGYDLTSCSRPVKTADFYNFDYIIGMDDSNIIALERKAPDLESKNKIHRMVSFSGKYAHDHVPDPYYGGASGFETVLDLLEDACDGLIEKLKV